MVKRSVPLDKAQLGFYKRTGLTRRPWSHMRKSQRRPFVLALRDELRRRQQQPKWKYPRRSWRPNLTEIFTGRNYNLQPIGTPRVPVNVLVPRRRGDPPPVPAPRGPPPLQRGLRVFGNLLNTIEPRQPRPYNGRRWVHNQNLRVPATQSWYGRRANAWNDNWHRYRSHQRGRTARGPAPRPPSGYGGTNWGYQMGDDTPTRPPTGNTYTPGQPTAAPTGSWDVNVQGGAAPYVPVAGQTPYIPDRGSRPMM